MHHYLIELSNPEKKIRHYLNSRVAKYTVKELNDRAGWEQYGYITTDDKYNIDSVGDNPVEDKVQFMEDEANK